MAEESTVLVLSGIGVPPYSARGLSQTLEPIDIAANYRRTINGALLDLSAAQFRKYKSTISGEDQRPPACDGVWPGKEVTVDCIAHLSFPDGGAPARPAVPDSTFTEEGFVFYRPRLVMLVTGLVTSHDEWGAMISWSLALEEK